MNAKQRRALQLRCERYGVEFRATDYHPQFDLPKGYVAGWVGGDERAGKTIYVGVSPEGEVSS